MFEPFINALDDEIHLGILYLLSLAGILSQVSCWFILFRYSRRLNTFTKERFNISIPTPETLNKLSAKSRGLATSMSKGSQIMEDLEEL